jgi:hypothetical protein
MNTNATVKWDPEKNVIKSEPKSTNAALEKRVAALEAQVEMLVKALASK